MRGATSAQSCHRLGCTYFVASKRELKRQHSKRNTGLPASAPAAHQLLQVGPQTFKVVAVPEPAPTTTRITRPSASTTSSSAPAPAFTNIPEAIAEAGGIDVVTQAMLMLPEEITVQRNGCLALANLAVTSFNRNMIGAADGVARVLVALKMHQTPEVQAAGCRALMNLATDNDRNSKVIAEAGLIPARVLARVLQLCYLSGPWLTISNDTTSLSRSTRRSRRTISKDTTTSHTQVASSTWYMRCGGSCKRQVCRRGGVGGSPSLRSLTSTTKMLSRRLVGSQP